MIPACHQRLIDAARLFKAFYGVVVEWGCRHHDYFVFRCPTYQEALSWMREHIEVCVDNTAPAYFSSANDDYELLCKIRNVWFRSDKSKWALFEQVLWAIQSARTAPKLALETGPAAHYEVGDYARAALAVLDTKVKY